MSLKAPPIDAPIDAFVWKQWFNKIKSAFVTSVTATTPIVSSGGQTPDISLTTVPITLGGTGQVTANAAFNALAPSQTGNANELLKTDGTNTSWAIAAIASGGTGQITANAAFNA